MIPLTFRPSGHASALTCTLDPPQPAHTVMTMAQMHQIASNIDGHPSFWEYVEPEPFVSIDHPASMFCFAIQEPPYSHHTTRLGLALGEHTDLEFWLPISVYFPLPDPTLQKVTIAKPPHIRLFLGTNSVHHDNVLLMLDPIDTGEPSIPLIFCPEERKFTTHLYHSFNASQLREAYHYARLLWTYR